MKKNWMLALAALVLLLPAVAAAQQPGPTADEDERIDTAMRKFGYISGEAFSCHTKDQQLKLERTALNVGTNILRLFGSDRAFLFAAAFGAGSVQKMDPKDCPGVIKQAEEMIGKLKVLSSR